MCQSLIPAVYLNDIHWPKSIELYAISFAKWSIFVSHNIRLTIMGTKMTLLVGGALCKKKLGAHLQLGCFQNLFSFISSAAPPASSSSCYWFTCTFTVDRKSGRGSEGENERETLMKGTAKWTASPSVRTGNSTNAPMSFSLSLLFALCVRRTTVLGQRGGLPADCPRAAECKSAWNPSWLFLFFFIFCYTSLMSLVQIRGSVVCVWVCAWVCTKLVGTH